MIQPGTAFPPFRHRIDGTRAEQFATAVGDVPHRLDAGYVEAPVGLLCFVSAQDPAPVFRSLGLGWGDILFGGMELAFRQPVRVGDVLSGRTEVSAYRERGDGHRRLGIATLTTTYVDERGTPVLDEASTLIVRLGAGPAGADGEAPGAAADAETEFRHVVTRMDIAWMAVALADPNPIHVDDGIARDAGFRSAIGHGTFPIGAIGAAVARRCGPGRVRRLAVRLTAPLYPGDELGAGVRAAEGTALKVRATAGGRTIATGAVEVAP